MNLWERLLNRASEEIAPYAGPLYFGRLDSGDEESVIDNGSFGLVKVDNRIFLVTCFHVWDGFEDARLKDSHLRMGVCLEPGRPVIFDQKPPITKSKLFDLAIFDATPVVSCCHGRKFFDLDANPPPSVSIGDKIVVLGYPGRFRTGSTTEVEFGRKTYALRITSVDDWRFQADVSDALSVDFKTSKPLTGPFPNPHGGISGSPCFLVRLQEPVRLIGFTTGYLMGQLFFTHANRIYSSGVFGQPNEHWSS